MQDEKSHAEKLDGIGTGSVTGVGVQENKDRISTKELSSTCRMDWGEGNQKS